MVSKLPSVRALDELNTSYRNMINSQHDDNIRDANAAIKSAKDSQDAIVVKQVMAAIEKLGIPYRIEHKSLCNIRNYSGNLSFTLMYDPEKNKSLKKITTTLHDADISRNKQLKRLQDWYRESLYRIANRKEIDVFEV